MFSAKRLQALSQDATVLGRVLQLKAECAAIYEAKHRPALQEATAEAVAV